MKFIVRITLFASVTAITSTLHGTVLVTAVDTTSSGTSPVGAQAPLTFNYPISQKVYNWGNGDFIVGIGPSSTDITFSSTDNPNNIIYLGQRPIGNEQPELLGIAAPAKPNYRIDSLALITRPAETKYYLAYTQVGNSIPPDTIYATTPPSPTTRVGSITNLADTAGNSPVVNIVALAGTLSRCNAYAGFIIGAAGPSQQTNTTGQVFGLTGSGIVVVTLQDATPEADNASLVLAQAAATGGKTADAVLLDPTVPQIQIPAQSNPAIVTFPDTQTDFTVNSSNPRPILYWSHYMERLYIGLSLATTNPAVTNGVKSVVVGRLLNDCGELTLYPIVASSAVSQAIFKDDNDGINSYVTNVVATTNPTGGNTNMLLEAYMLRVMHCSTGPSYLIVNGDATNYTNTAQAPFVIPAFYAPYNTVYALPLVDTPIDNPVAHGTLADYTQPLIHGRFTTPATLPGQIYLSTDAPAVVGGGPLPIEKTTEPWDMQVIDDAVYISVGGGANSLNDHGLFYSEAMFDTTGKIVRWTPWSKKAFPDYAFCDGISFFAVDAVTSRIWAVDGGTRETVLMTAWDRGGAGCAQNQTPCGPQDTTCPGKITRSCCGKNVCKPKPCHLQKDCFTLTAALCRALPDGCYSYLDLDQGTHGFTGADFVTLNRFALFGGNNKVVFTLISHAYEENVITGPTTNTLPQNTPQKNIYIFDCPNTFLVTPLPKNGCSLTVESLEYTRQTGSTSPQFFFAGTAKGLYVYAHEDGTGFTQTALNDLCQLQAGTWQLIDQFTDPIIDLKMSKSGDALYIITRKVTSTSMTSYLYRVPYATTVAAMFEQQTPALLAQSGSGTFSSTCAFYEIQPLVSGVTSTDLTVADIASEQLILGTNYGFFVTNARGPTGTIADDPTSLQWRILPTYDTPQMYPVVAGPDAPIPSTAWPVNLESCPAIGTYERSEIHQVSVAQGSGATGIAGLSDPVFTQFCPSFFNARPHRSPFETLDSILYFWTDGGRRFFIVMPYPITCCTINKNQLMTFPYDIYPWNICTPGGQIIRADYYVAAVDRFYWVSHIGSSGILMAGTNDGVVALE